ncbi:LysR family transcriptional regulator ArgP [Aestuariirhabdus litorea]|uniref:LysR family transcriptional regulator ArgP n=1 Tax=Aestuariirhabdus litorea TaxID=2528527 RepID=A0A3P3VKT6_9GAMM|nr:LysR family transcriptional regulator ArgP [Aestuariirhabdus litorea]RRJ82379.1 LysR family transcriptional regulator ArgP [Aestuariirhabdus litorea]RWW92542.1 ArgP/LysG family DNA-binding transcriptional regulator [Endozoicomonadaceae bacterium GTF-13]
MMDYKLVEAVAAVIECGGFEKAAQRLNLTQSAVSQRVRLLEERMATPLIIRATPPQATDSGLRLLRHYQQVHTLELSLVDELSPQASAQYKTLSIGINADSLATWFLDSIADECRQQRLLLDLHSADESVTLGMLRRGQVIGCISSSAEPIQGCRIEPLGRMAYIAVATPAFIRHHFPRGVCAEGLRGAPTVIFNLDDRLQERYLQQHFQLQPGEYPHHLLPSTQAFADAAQLGIAYSLVPRLQVERQLREGSLQELAPGRAVYSELYWHYWNIRSPLLDRLSRTLIREAGSRLLPIKG